MLNILYKKIKYIQDELGYHTELTGYSDGYGLTIVISVFADKVYKYSHTFSNEIILRIKIDEDLIVDRVIRDAIIDLKMRLK